LLKRGRKKIRGGVLKRESYLSNTSLVHGENLVVAALAFGGA